jgi:polygalacturonase
VVFVLAVVLWNTEFGRKHVLPSLLMSLAPSAEAPPNTKRDAPSVVIDAVTHGAVADDGKSDTIAIQSAIRACSAAGGGEVRLSGGVFLAGELELATGVTLVVERNAVLRASCQPEEFPNRAWIHARAVEDAGVRGPGKLVGNGSTFFDIKLRNVLAWKEEGSPTGAVKHPVEVKGTPFTFLLQFAECQRVVVEQLTIEDSPHWTIHVIASVDVRIEHVTVKNLIYGPYTDGINIDSSSDVLVRNCVVTAGDDAFCVKSSNHLGLLRPARNIAFENCLARSPTNGFKIGTETQEDISDVTFRNCRVEPPMPGVVPLAGLNIASVDGSYVRNVLAEHITMKSVRCPALIRLGDRGRNVPPDRRRMSVLDGVTLSDITVAQARQPIIIAGLSGHPVQNVSLRGITVRQQVTSPVPIRVDDIPELPSAYPESTMFGRLPATGLFARHCSGLTIDKVVVCPSRSRLFEPMMLSDVTAVEGKVLLAR